MLRRFALVATLVVSSSCVTLEAPEWQLLTTAPLAASINTVVTVRVTLRHNDAPAILERVTFKVTSGGGSLSETETLTDFAGEAKTTWNLGAVKGDQKMEVTAGPTMRKVVTITTTH